jgi:hypothetical protein
MKTGRGSVQHNLRLPDEAYGLLWDLINGAGAWAADPWVAAYSFTVQHGNIDHLGSAS